MKKRHILIFPLPLSLLKKLPIISGSIKTVESLAASIEIEGYRENNAFLAVNEQV